MIVPMGIRCEHSAPDWKSAAQLSKRTMVEEEPAVRNKWCAVKYHYATAPIESPGRPTPTKPTKETQINRWTKRNKCARTKPSGVVIARKWNDWRSIDQ